MKLKTLFLRAALPESEGMPAASLYQRMDGIFARQILRDAPFLPLDPAGLSLHFQRRCVKNS